MGLIICPECKNEVSDRAEACPKCGYPIAKRAQPETAQADAPQNNAANGSEAKKKFDINKLPLKKLCIIIGAILLVCIIAAVAYFFLNRENISIARAQTYTAEQKYDKVIDVLEEYKDNPDAKQLYDNAVFMTSDEGHFIMDFADGLKARWDENERTPEGDLKVLVNLELDKLNKYRDVVFDDETFNQKAHDYIDALDDQLNALSYINTDYIQYTNMWADAYSDRSVLIAYFLNNYPVPIDDKYADTKNEFKEAAAGIAADNEFKQKIETMIHKNNFQLTDVEGDWNTYSISITNETDKTFDYFHLNVNCLDADGNIVSQEITTSINNFAPNQTAAFEFNTDSNPQSLSWMAEYSVQ